MYLAIHSTATHGLHRTGNELRKLGVFVSGSGVRLIWVRHNLENFKKRLKALEENVANDGTTLTDTQVTVLDKKKHDDEACGVNLPASLILSFGDIY